MRRKINWQLYRQQVEIPVYILTWFESNVDGRWLCLEEVIKMFIQTYLNLVINNNEHWVFNDRFEERFYQEFGELCYQTIDSGDPEDNDFDVMYESYYDIFLGLRSMKSTRMFRQLDKIVDSVYITGEFTEIMGFVNNNRTAILEFTPSD